MMDLLWSYNEGVLCMAKCCVQIFFLVCNSQVTCMEMVTAENRILSTYRHFQICHRPIARSETWAEANLDLQPECKQKFRYLIQPDQT